MPGIASYTYKYTRAGSNGYCGSLLCMVAANVPIFVLSTAVVRVELQVLLPKSMRRQEVVKEADDGICPLSNCCSLINKVIYLHVRKHL